MYINTEFIKNNVPNLIFYILYNTYTGYLLLTHTYYEHDYLITSCIAYYELLNTFYEFRNRPVKKEMIVHHAVTSANSFFLLYSYTTNPEFIRDVMYCQTLIMSSTLYLNIRNILPHSVIPRVVFFFSFFYYRFYLPYPYVYKFLMGEYGDSTVIRIVYVNCGLLYCLSIYWGFLILRIAYKALKLKVADY
jgi:hypothetical protein